MHSKTISTFFVSFLICWQLIGCGPMISSPKSDDNIIGVSVDEVSSLNPPNEAEANHIVLFDKTVRRLHQFDLSKMKFVRSNAVNNPGEDHFVLYNNIGNYTIDLTLKGLSIFNRFDQANHDPIQLQGKPKSAAFHRSLGLLVVYDDLMSVGLIKLDSVGNVVNSWVGGANVTSNLTISSGDINEQGKLILTLNDDSIVVMDIEQSIAQKNWVVSSPRFTTTLSQISWIAPVTGTTSQVLIKASSDIHLLDLTTQTVLATYPLNGFQYVGSFKSKSPHIVIRQGTTLKVIYASAGTLTNKTFYLKQYPSMYNGYSISQSVLDLSKDQWSFIDSYSSYTGWYDTSESKTYNRYRVSDLLAIHSRSIAAGVQTQLGDNYIFNLFPSELGYATRQNLDNTGASSEIKLFNIPYVRK